MLDATSEDEADVGWELDGESAMTSAAARESDGEAEAMTVTVTVVVSIAGDDAGDADAEDSWDTSFASTPSVFLLGTKTRVTLRLLLLPSRETKELRSSEGGADSS
jgi:hypothetical protein